MRKLWPGVIAMYLSVGTASWLVSRTSQHLDMWRHGSRWVRNSISNEKLDSVSIANVFGQVESKAKQRPRNHGCNWTWTCSVPWHWHNFRCITFCCITKNQTNCPDVILWFRLNSPYNLSIAPWAISTFQVCGGPHIILIHFSCRTLTH